jgi:hypothetical protein
MDQIIVWEFTDGSILVTTTAREAAMIEDYKACDWFFDEADRTVIEGNTAQFRSAIKFSS